MRKSIVAATLLFLLSLTAHAQTFSSGSTGADGALDLSNAPDNQNFYVQLPESGVLNYTTVNIPRLKVLGFKRNSRNTPAIILAQGNVLIVGSIEVDQASFNSCCFIGFDVPGPGGFYGGAPNQPGFGPGGGQLPPGIGGGRWVGPLSLSPIVGGSGGRGTAGRVGCGGGGAIIIASSGTITMTSTAFMSAGTFVFIGSVCNFDNGGSGGAIRLVANALDIAGQLRATGANNGVIRLEATSLTFTGSSVPAAVLAPINPTIVLSAMPQLTIQSVGGYAVPSYAGSRFDTVDLLLPNQLPDPLSVVVRANNIPVGTQINVGFVSGSGQATSAPGTLSGSFASSSATATISNLNRTGVTYLLATAVFDVPQSAQNANPPGKNQVERVRVEAAPGKEPKFVFLRKDGSAVETAKLAPAFLRQFGQ